MPASIQTTLYDSPGGSPVVGAPILVGVSRDDLRKGYQVELVSVDVHTTYDWTLEFLPDAPDGTLSAATLDIAAVGSFTIVDATNITDGDHVDIGGISLTAKAAAPGFDEYLIVIGDNNATATNAAAAINAVGSSFNGVVTANAVGNVVELTAAATGTAGNAITLTTTLVNAGVITVSGATMTGGSDAFSKTVLFNVDYEGPYLVKLVVDQGLVTEDTQWVRLRFLTRFADMTLVAGGERRDATGLVPVDVDDDGWSQEQNNNVQKLLGLVRRLSSSGRILYVDANRGRDSANTPNDTTVSVLFPGSDSADPDGSGFSIDGEGYADFSTIQEAIDYAANAASRGEPAPSADDPYTIRVRPGLYEEDLALEAFVSIQGLTPTPLDIATVIETNYVQIKGLATFSPASLFDVCQIQGLTFFNDDAVTTEPVFKQTNGTLGVVNCAFRQEGNGASQGPAFSCETNPSIVTFHDCLFRSDATTDDARFVFIHDTNGTVIMTGGSIAGRSGIGLNPSFNTDCNMLLERGAEVDVTSGYAIRGGGKILRLFDTHIRANDPDKSIVLDGHAGGPGALASDHALYIQGGWIEGHLIYDETLATGTTTVSLHGVRFGNVADTDLIQFPTGNPDVFDTEQAAFTIRYVPDYVDPLTGAAAVAPADQLVAENVQNAIDELVNQVAALATTSTVDVDAGPSYVVAAGVGYIGVDTATPATTIGIILPDTVATGAVDGRQIIIKDEGGGAGAGGQEINIYTASGTSTIDGVVRAAGTPLVINTNFSSVTLMCRGASGTTSEWYII